MKDERRMRASLCRNFERITRLWKLRDEECLKILDIQSQNRFNAFCSGLAPIPDDVFSRIICVIQIHSALRDLLSGNESAMNSWVLRPNKAKIFKGRPALDLLISGDMKKLELVRDYLQGESQSPYL